MMGSIVMRACASVALALTLAAPVVAQQAAEEQWTRSALSDNFASVETHCSSEQVETADRGAAYGLNCEVDGKRITLLHIPEDLWLRMSSVGDFETAREGLRTDAGTDFFEDRPVGGFEAFRALSSTSVGSTGIVIARVSPERLLLLMVRSENGTMEEQDWVARSFERVANSLIITGAGQ